MRHLDTSHRCDRCGAQAYVITVLHSGGLLKWCNHDWQKNKHVLLPMVADMVDDTAALHESIVDDKHAVG